jgi:hypothetical protein
METKIHQNLAVQRTARDEQARGVREISRAHELHANHEIRARKFRVGIPVRKVYY